MTLEHTPPQLSPDGERILAAVLESRQANAMAPASELIDLDSSTGSMNTGSSGVKSAPTRAFSVLLPAFIVLGGLVTAVVISLSLDNGSSTTNPLEVEVAGVVEERVESISSVDVTLLTNQTPNEGIRRFDLRLQGLSIATGITADRFEVQAFDESGETVITIARTSSGVLEPGGFIDLMVRVEGVQSSDVVVQVLLDGVAIEQLLLD